MITDPKALPYFLTVDDVADLLRTTKRGVYCKHHRGLLAGAVRNGMRLLFIRDRLLESLTESCASSQPRKRGKR